MALPLNIPNYLELAKISQFLAANDQNNFAKNQGGTIYPSLARLIYIVRTSIEWKYQIDNTDTSLIDTGNYLKALIGKYSYFAANIIGGAGGTFINPPSGSQIGIIGVDYSFEIGDVDSPIDAGDTVLVLTYNNPILNTVLVFRDETEMPPNDINVASYSVTYTTTTVTITFTVAVENTQRYRIMFLRYTI